MSATTWRIPTGDGQLARETNDFEEVKLFMAAQGKPYQSSLGGKSRKKTEEEKPVVRHQARAL